MLNANWPEIKSHRRSFVSIKTASTGKCFQLCLPIKQEIPAYEDLQNRLVNWCSNTDSAFSTGLYTPWRVAIATGWKWEKRQLTHGRKFSYQVATGSTDTPHRDGTGVAVGDHPKVLSRWGSWNLEEADPRSTTQGALGRRRRHRCSRRADRAQLRDLDTEILIGQRHCCR